MRTSLQIAGVLQLALALAHFWFPRRFGWYEEMQRVSLLTRQVFWVHMGFIMLVLTGFGGLSLFCTEDLLGKSHLARVVLGGLASFWVLRGLCQFFVYRPELWRGSRVNTFGHLGFSLLWTFLAAVYLVAFYRQF